ncbi:RHS repeat domain-containing protein [Capnocytophaga sp. oral taxon 902]|uniref:RHS repeat domain-containing protein n=3 Tax=Capnocytophaga TaxID=1016 RepID=UPI002105C0BC|nr:RHS repeat-associated core domain-containing protein [Capnocytophaga sp. oral taxon 902]
MLTDEEGNIAERRHFDPWGHPIKVEDGAGKVLQGLTLLDRGFTGHEHLQTVGLVHMNGRLYDPALHRFLQPDNYVQDPFNTQNFNRYGYCLNNPLVYVDENGEFFHLIIGAVVGGILNWAFNGARLDAKGLGYFAVGAVAGAVGAGIGSGVSASLAGGTFAGGFMSGTAVSSSLFSSFASGFSAGFSSGFISGAGNSWINGNSFLQGIYSGVNMGTTSGFIGGAINVSFSGIRNLRQLRAFRKGNSLLGINDSNEAVPMTDDFIKRAQEAWYPDAPTNNLLNHSVENVPTKYINLMNKNGAAAVTIPQYSNGIITGNASIYYNTGGQAFSSAKQLFYCMGHELVHLSQYTALAGQSAGIVTKNFMDLLEYHAYSFEFSLGSGNAGGFNQQAIRELYREFPNFFNSLGYMRFPWTFNTKFRYPF